MAFNLLNETRVSLTVESRELRLLITSGRRVKAWMSYPLPPDLFQNGGVANGEAFETALSGLFYGRGDLRGHLSVCFPGGRSLFRTTALPKLNSKMAAQAVEREALREFGIEKGKAHLFWQKTELDAAGQHYFMASVPKPLYDGLYQSLRHSKIRPRLWEIKPLALVRAVRRPQVIILDLEQDNVDLILAVGGVPRLYRSLSPMKEASTAERADRWCAEVLRSIEYYTNNQPERPWGPGGVVVLTGALAADREIADAVEKVSTVPVEDFVSPLEAPSNFPAATYAAALGVAMKKGNVSGRSSLKVGAVDFNLYPAEYPRPGLPIREGVITLGFLAAVGGLSPLYVANANASERVPLEQGVLTNLQQQATAVRASQVKASQLQTQATAITAQAVSFQQDQAAILSSGGNMAADMLSVLNFAPAQVNVTKYTEDSGLIGLEGQAQAYGLPLLYAQALQRSGEFQTVTIDQLSQTAVAGGNGATFTMTLKRLSASS